MALKLLVILAISNLAHSVPAPDPGPEIRIDVQQVVNVGGCCPEKTCGNQKTCTFMGQHGVCGIEEQPPFIKNVGHQECENDCECYIGGCVFGDTVYPIGAIAPDTCVELKCVEVKSIEGICTDAVWKYTGNYVNGCGNCTVFGDPHIITYDAHLLDGQLFTEYESPRNLTGEYAISQYGRHLVPSSSFGVYALFTTCSDPRTTATCATRVHYAEPGINVELVLPEKLTDDNGYCLDTTTHDPKCATKILVNGKLRSIADDGSVSSFPGIAGTVLIFKKGACTSKRCQIFVVGSEGITVRLEVNPNFGSYEWYHLNIYPLPSLRSDLYGLCDKYTGATNYDYTLQNGSLITTWNDADKDIFIESWMVPKTN